MLSVAFSWLIAHATGVCFAIIIVKTKTSLVSMIGMEISNLLVVVRFVTVGRVLAALLHVADHT